ncbi:MAG: nitrate reductase molybdenum cofactor assembly chaperone [Rhodospirillales bacterium]
MQKTLKALSALLSYPSAELQEAVGAIRDALAADRLLPRTALGAIEPLLSDLETGDLYDLEERYVALFDRSRTLSLNLFEHLHGESRARGGAMVDLLETYRAGGYEPTGRELPDHLPVLLEFLSTRDLAESRETLGDAAHILEVLKIRLGRRESAYAAVFAALVAVGGAQPDAEARTRANAELEEDPDDLEALDAVWAESEVVFGLDPDAGCPASRDLLARMATQA